MTILRPALLLAGLILIGLALHLLAGGDSAGLLARLAARHSLAGDAVFVGVGALLCAVGVPRQIVAYAAGFAFGLWLGAALSLACQMAGCTANFVWARLAARDWARRLMERRWKGRLARIDGFLSANPFSATLTLRLLPVGNNLVLNLLAGLSGIAAIPFLAGSLLGYLPQTIIFALIGTGSAVDRTAQLATGVALFVLSAAVGVLLLRRYRAVAPT